MLEDIRQASRRLTRAPSFSLAVLATVILTSGVAVAAFSVVYAVVIRPLPYSDPSRLVVIWTQEPERAAPVVEISYRSFRDWRALNRSCDDLAVFGSVNWSFRLRDGGETADVPYAAVSGSFFSTLGAGAALGRTLGENDDRSGAQPVVVVSHGFWQRRMGAATDAVGRTLELSGEHYSVVGVMPPEFDFPRGAQLWASVVPVLEGVSREHGFDALEERRLGVLYALARLKRGVTAESARGEINAIIAKVEPDISERRVVLTPLVDHLHGRTRAALLLLLGAALLILGVACANVSTLFLMRAARMRRAMAIRLAVGATRIQLWRLWFSESLILFLVGGTGGFLLGHLCLPPLRALAAQSVYRVDEAAVGWTALVFVIAISVAGAAATTLVAGLVSARTRTSGWLGAGSHTVTASQSRRSRRTLVTLEMALAFVLLVGAGLTIRSFVTLRQLDLGFEPSRLLTFDVAPPESKYPPGTENARFYALLLDRIRAIPGVQKVGAVFLRPLAHEAIGSDGPVLLEGQDPEMSAAWRESPGVNKEAITPGYFEAMQIPVRRGRSFDGRDTRSGPLVTILSEGAARALWPGEDPIGKRILVGGDSAREEGDAWPWRTVVGIVGDVRYRGLQDVRYDLYLPYLQVTERVPHLFVRTSGDPSQSIDRVKTEIDRFEPAAVVGGFTSMEDVLRRLTNPWRLITVLFTILGGMALGLSAVGVYGLVAYAVVERRHEIGIRLALGASSGQIAALFVSEGAKLALIGLPLGLAVAVALKGFAARIVFGIAPTDLPTWALVVVLLALLALLASYLPARAAQRISPADLLRQGEM